MPTPKQERGRTLLLLLGEAIQARGLMEPLHDESLGLWVVNPTGSSKAKASTNSTTIAHVCWDLWTNLSLLHLGILFGKLLIHGLPTF